MIKPIMNSVPEDIKRVLKQRIITNQYTAQELTDWLKEQGHSVSKSSMARYCIEIRGLIIGLHPLVGISKATAIKHRKDIDCLGDLFTQKTFIEMQIKTLKQAIFASEVEYQADKQGDKNAD
ncbi:MAG: DUF3486 family protein [Methylococcales bacterium]|nr:DUF3486 family protein [Methylococcales bacterium]